MTPKKKRMIIVLSALIAISAIGSFAHYDGSVAAINPQLTVVIRSSSGWYIRPDLEARATDPDGVYVIVPGSLSGDRFEGIRIDARDGTQTNLALVIGPDSPFRPFVAAPTTAKVWGLSFPRPQPYLMGYLNGKGPGIESVPSDTGLIKIFLNDAEGLRPLLRRYAFNSYDTLNLTAKVSTDPHGQRIAALLHTAEGWTLHLFSRSLPESQKPDKR